MKVAMVIKRLEEVKIVTQFNASGCKFITFFSPEPESNSIWAKFEVPDEMSKGEFQELISLDNDAYIFNNGLNNWK